MNVIEVRFEMDEVKSVEDAEEMMQAALSALRSTGTWRTKLTFAPSVISKEEGESRWVVLVEATWVPPRQTADELGEMVVGKPAAIAEQWGRDRHE